MRTTPFAFALAISAAMAAQAASNGVRANVTADAEANATTDTVASTNAADPISAPEEASEPAAEFTKPTLKDISDAINSTEQSADPKAYELFSETMKWDLRTSRAIDDLFQRFRNYDAALVKKPMTSARKRMAEYFNKANPPAKKTGSRFVLCYPGRVAVTRGGKAVMEDAETVYKLDELMSAADNAFSAATSKLMMNRFINWGGASRGTIFLIADHAAWLRVRKGAGDVSPVQIVVTEEERREFYVLANPAHSDLLGQAIGYAVASLVLKEYSAVALRQQDLRARAPLFFSCGFAAQASGLKAVLTPDGPHQVKTYNGVKCTPATIAKMMADAKNGKVPTDQLPLDPNQLYRCDRLFDMPAYSSDNEKIYYAMRQGEAMVEYLQKNGALSYIALEHELAVGRSMSRAFDDAYVKIRNLVNGKDDDKETAKKNRSDDKDKEDKKQARRDAKAAKEAKKAEKVLEDTNKYTPDEVLKKYNNLTSRAHDAVFMPLTAKPTADKP